MNIFKAIAVKDVEAVTKTIPVIDFGPAFRGEFLRIVEAHDASPGIEDDRGGNDRAEQRATPGFIESGDAGPAKFARRSLETGRAEAAHWYSRSRYGIGIDCA